MIGSIRLRLQKNDFVIDPLTGLIYPVKKS